MDFLRSCVELLVTISSSWKCHPSLRTCVPDLFWLCLLADELVPVWGYCWAQTLPAFFSIIFNTWLSVCVPKCCAVCHLVALQGKAKSGYRLAMSSHSSVVLWSVQLWQLKPCLPSCHYSPSLEAGFLFQENSHVCTRYTEGSSLVL